MNSLLEKPNPQTKHWLFASVFAVALGGLFSILLVAARTPRVQDMLPPTYKDFFHSALIVHVDLTVLTWFLGMSAVFWLLGREQERCTASNACWWVMLLGIVVMTISPFMPNAHPLLNNYVPVLDHPVFFTSLALIGLAIAGIATLSILSPIKAGATELERLALCTSPAILLVAITCMALSWWQIPADISGRLYYEILFWAGGHHLQFVYVQLLILAWLWLIAETTGKTFTHHIWKHLLWLPVIAVAGGIIALFIWPVESYEHRRFYSLQMAFILGAYVIPFGLWSLQTLWQQRKTLSQPALIWPLAMSLMLFAAGGIISTLIEEEDVTIPAHYHGSIVGVSLAFMGIAYALMPRLGYAEIGKRISTWQACLYGGGQLLHITGLLISGGYDVARKSLETYEGVMGARIGMGLMGAGGGIAIIGGVLFVIALWKSWRRHSA